MGAFGGYNPNRDPMRNAALSAQFTDYEHKRDSAPISPVKRRIACIVMICLVIILVAIIALFLLL